MFVYTAAIFIISVANKAWRKALLLAFLLMSMLDTGGNYAIFTYASVILRESKIIVSPELQAMSFPAVMIMGSLLSMSCVEKFGRKVSYFIFFNFIISILFIN